MKKAISISIGGLVFSVEEDAYASLQNYLSSLHRIFDKSEGGDEIMEDIEIRISELFTQRLNSKYQVVNQSHVDEIIGILGQPEDYQSQSDFDEEPKAKKSATKETESQRHGKRKVYRDVDDKVIAGVCSGLAHYFGWDTTWVRLGAVLLMFFALGPLAPIAYIIMWAVFPKAITTSEKIQMKGNPVNIDSIKKKVDSSFDSIKDSVNDVDKKKGVSNFFDSIFDAIGSLFSSLGSVAESVFRVAWLIFKKGLGVYLVFLGTVLLFGLIFGFTTSELLIFNNGGSSNFDFSFDLLDQLFLHGEASLTMLFIGFVLVVGPILFLLFYLGFKLLFEFKTKFRGLGYFVFLSLLIGGVLLTVVGVNTAVAFSNETKTEEIMQYSSDTLSLSIMEDIYFSSDLDYQNCDFMDLVKVENDDLIFGQSVNLDLKASSSDKFEISIEKSSAGSSKMDAVENIESMFFDYTVNGSHIVFSPNIVVPAENKFHDQEVNVTVFIPEGKTLFLVENINRVNFHDWRLCSGKFRNSKCDNIEVTNKFGRIVSKDEAQKEL